MTEARPPRARPLAAADLPAAAFAARQPIRFEHCDTAGIVFFARYFTMMQGAVEDWFGVELGLDYAGIIQRRRVGLGYAHAECDYFKPGRLGDVLGLTVLVDTIGRSSIGLAIHGHRDGEPVLVGRLVLVTTDINEAAAIPVPDDIRSAVESYQRRCAT
ncbi:4-hydroxybenzoyl-CoA thioesterase [Inquilinus ginsengisoli]|uniref:4-hydroxybenzoyl-CoA thioesterase n=1 Tax=Inquilinus ginsengisoli TaxID=363840 RepID=A0ABU1JKQ4_9PROT|nr:thioesterase family protein [Inquilinus ginsengisoli]MDR6289186.1 4-hydroxybenzoyl-CoA thioesterase [Inquilinus ginsengisoli]